MEAALARLPGVTPEQAREASRLGSYTFNGRHNAVLLNLAGDLYHYELGADSAVRLTRGAGEEELASYSPDGTLVAFVRRNDLHVVDVAGRRERALTSGGSDDLLNGKLDWVYQEEVYGRGNFKAYWWSPDSSRIAFLSLDEARVPRFTLVDDRAVRPVVEAVPYPKAGDPNPVARLGVVRAGGVMSGGTFHTARITGKRRWFLGASTEWPGVVPEEDVELGDADQLARKYPEAAADIRTFPVPAEK